MNLHDLDPVRFTWYSDLDLPVEPAGPPEGGIDRIDAVRGADHHDLSAFLEPVHHGQELGYDPAFHFPGHFLAPGGNGVQFIDEDDRGGVLAGLLEDLAEPLFALAVIFRDYFGPGNRNKMGTALACYRFCDQGLSRPRRTVEQDTLGGLDTQFLEEFRVAQGKFDGLAEPLELVF